MCFNLIFFVCLVQCNSNNISFKFDFTTFQCSFNGLSVCQQRIILWKSYKYSDYVVANFHISNINLCLAKSECSKNNEIFVRNKVCYLSNRIHEMYDSRAII